MPVEEGTGGGFDEGVDLTTPEDPITPEPVVVGPGSTTAPVSDDGTSSPGIIIPVYGVTVEDLEAQGSGYGDPREYRNGVHRGLDIGAAYGTAVVAPVSGTIIAVGDSGYSGLRIWIQGADGNGHFLAHLSAANVTVGQQVTAGQQIGAVGNSGTSAEGTTDNAHLHYGISTTGGMIGGDDAPWTDPFPILTGGTPAPEPGETIPDPTVTAGSGTDQTLDEQPMIGGANSGPTRIPSPQINQMGDMGVSPTSPNQFGTSHDLMVNVFKSISDRIRTS